MGKDKWYTHRDIGRRLSHIALNNVLTWQLKSPEWLYSVLEEVNAELTSRNTMAPYEKANNTPYLRACLDKNLRITQPIGFSLPRCTPIGRGAYTRKVCSWKYSGILSSYVVHREERVFLSAEKFNPVAGLVKADEKSNTVVQHLVPFLEGIMARTSLTSSKQWWWRVSLTAIRFALRD